MAHRCIKPQCPTDCTECNHALPEDDEAAMLVCDLLDAFAVSGFDQPLEDGESQLVDRARAWLASRRSASLPELPTCTESQTAIDWGRVERAEALGVAVHVTPAIDEKCDHEWEGADGNPERCSKCGLSFMRYVHSCCP